MRAKKVYALYDKNAHVAYGAAMEVFYHATMAAMDEAGDAFETAYAAAMRESGYLALNFLKRNATD